MKPNNDTRMFFNYLIILLSIGVAGCKVTTQVKVNTANTILAGQKAQQGTPPPTLMPTAPWAVKNAFSYDFNRDGKPDWVVVANYNTHNEWLKHSLNIALSQPAGKLQPVVSSNFDPSEKGDVPWRMSAMLTDSGDLRITNNKYTPMGGSDNQNSYRFRFINGEFVLQEYSFGYGSSTRGSTFMFDLANHNYSKQDAGRCDYEPKPPCEGTQDAKMVNVPKLTLTNFGSAYGANPSNTDYFENYIVGGDMFLRNAAPRPHP